MFSAFRPLHRKHDEINAPRPPRPSTRVIFSRESVRVRVLIADSDVATVRLIKSTLEKAGHAVSAVATGEGARARLEDGGFDLLITEWMLPDLDGTAICRHVRSRLPQQPAILLISALGGPPARAHALHVGADEFLVKPIGAVPLLLAVKSVCARPRRAPPKIPISEIVGHRPNHPLEATAAWSAARETICETLAGCTSLEICPTKKANPSEEVRATLGMVDVEHQVELVVGLFTSRATGSALAYAMLGEAATDGAVLQEMLGELCNNVLGAMKAAMRSEDYTFTLALPTGAQPAARAELTATLEAVATYDYNAPNVEMHVVVGVRPTGNIAMAVEALAENMVLAESVINEAGILILAAGTRLTPTTAGRFAHHLPGGRVRVCVVAPKAA